MCGWTGFYIIWHVRNEEVLLYPEVNEDWKLPDTIIYGEKYPGMKVLVPPKDLIFGKDYAILIDVALFNKVIVYVG